ncbi:hypothetical protein CFC21_005693 [Triticum aestivum]|uniref:Knottin scorpion toxin-like domain-containing protein n=2 Tax=Triticum aestivum TaxID=4565 RepID=A0A3B5YTA2_WHEAT|nr:hypothetical protein CFC21_005693 [Triticum aestivum]
MRTTQILLLGLALMVLSSDMATIEGEVHCGPEIGTGPLPCDRANCTTWCRNNGGKNAECVPGGCRCVACWKEPPSSPLSS